MADHDEWPGGGPLGHTARDLLPLLGEACARVFRPARRGDEAVLWEEVAEHNGTTMHPAAEWGSLTRGWAVVSQPPVWDGRPTYGALDPDTSRALSRALAPWACAGEPLRGAIWEGDPASGAILRPRATGRHRDCGDQHPHAPRKGFDGEALLRACHDRAGRAEFEHGSLTWLGLHGSLEELLQTEAPRHAEHHPAALLWSPDKWAVATWIDLLTTYITGPREMIDAILHEPGLEAREIPPDQSVAWDADTVNPLPPPP